MKQGLELLNEIIDQSGLKKSYLADACDISKASFSNKVSGLREFNLREIKVLKKELHLSLSQVDKIFL